MFSGRHGAAIGDGRLAIGDKAIRREGMIERQLRLLRETIKTIISPSARGAEI